MKRYLLVLCVALNLQLLDASSKNENNDTTFSEETGQENSLVKPVNIELAPTKPYISQNTASMSGTQLAQDMTKQLEIGSWPPKEERFLTIIYESDVEVAKKIITDQNAIDTIAMSIYGFDDSSTTQHTYNIDQIKEVLNAKISYNDYLKAKKESEKANTESEKAKAENKKARAIDKFWSVSTPKKLFLKAKNMIMLVSRFLRILRDAMMPEDCLAFARGAKTPEQLQQYLEKTKVDDYKVKHYLKESDLAIIRNTMVTDAITKAQNGDDSLLKLFNNIDVTGTLTSPDIIRLNNARTDFENRKTTQNNQGDKANSKPRTGKTTTSQDKKPTEKEKERENVSAK